MFPVCGKSMKLYGQAVMNPALGGPVFEMSLEDYNRDKDDIIGNSQFQQQWIPEFYEIPPETTSELQGVDTEASIAASAAAPAIPDPPPPMPDPLDPPIIPNLKVRKSIMQRAKDAGVYKKGMSVDEMKSALGFPD